MRYHIRPVAQKLGITKRIGWHTFRHTYSTLLRAVGAELKVMQELLRHATIRVTLDGYTQAVTAAKRAAQSAVVSLIGDAKTQQSVPLGPAPEVISVIVCSAAKFGGSRGI